MPLVDVGLQVFPTPAGNSASNSVLIIDAVDEVAGVMIEINKTGSISHVHFRTATVTGGATVDVRLETIDLTNGNATGTLWGTNTNASQVIANNNDNTWFRVALTASASVTAGDILAALVVNPSASAGNMQLSCGLGWNNASLQTGEGYGNTPTRSLKSDPGIIIILEYSDGTFVYSTTNIPLMSGSTAINTGTNPDEVALYFTAPCTMRVTGWQGIFAVVAGGDFRIALYQDGDNTPKLTYTHDGNITGGTTGRLYHGFFSSEYIIQMGLIYRLSVVPLTAASVTYYRFDGPSVTNVMDLKGLPGAHFSQRNRTSTTDPDSATWTQTTTRIADICLLIDQFDSEWIYKRRMFTVRT